MENAERYLTRWHDAGLIDETTAAAIRQFEAGQHKPAGRQWQVLLALILGGILLGAGVLLFVAAHWENVSPLNRLAMVLFMLVFFHGLALLTRDYFAGFATAMHALGTVSSGAAIALIGQIFNMQEHWPAAVLLWALCAGAGWLLLRDQFQQTLTLALFPAWMVCEYCYRVGPYSGSSVYIARILAVLATVYLCVLLHSKRRAAFGILFGVGAVMLPVAVGILAEGFEPGYGINHFGFVPVFWRVATVVMIAVMAAVAVYVERQSWVPVLAAIVLAYGLPWARARQHMDGFNGSNYDFTGPSLLAYAMVAAAAIVLVVWGVRLASKALVNYGIAAFAVTVIWFYFSSVMDKLGRSLGLIVLGVLFLAGGWALEQTRRRLVGAMEDGVA